MRQSPFVQNIWLPPFFPAVLCSPSMSVSGIIRDQYDAPLLLHSPSEHSAVIETASPGTRASFAAFSVCQFRFGPQEKLLLLKKPLATIL